MVKIISPKPVRVHIQQSTKITQLSDQRPLGVVAYKKTQLTILESKFNQRNSQSLAEELKVALACQLSLLLWLLTAREFLGSTFQTELITEMLFKNYKPLDNKTQRPYSQLITKTQIVRKRHSCYSNLNIRS